MAQTTKTSKVKGGWVKRDLKSGRLLEVVTEEGTFRTSPWTIHAVNGAVVKRNDALKRLANR